MALDSTLSEASFRRSIKKYFVDNLYTAQGVYVSFSTIFQKPEHADGTPINSWISFHFDGLNTENSVSIGRVSSYLFSREDTDGEDLASLRDKLIDLLVDLNQVDGMARIPLYDDVWNVVGYMMPTVGRESMEERGKDKTLYKFVNIYFRFGAK